MKRFDEYYSYQGGTFLIARFTFEGEGKKCLDCGRRTPVGTRKSLHDAGCPVHRRRQQWNAKMKN